MGGRGSSSGRRSTGWRDLAPPLHTNTRPMSDLIKESNLETLRDAYNKSLDRGDPDEKRARIRMTMEDIHTRGFVGQTEYDWTDEQVKAFIRERTGRRRR